MNEVEKHILALKKQKKFDDLEELHKDANPFANVDDVALYVKKLRESSIGK